MLQLVASSMQLGSAEGSLPMMAWHGMAGSIANKMWQFNTLASFERLLQMYGVAYI